MTTLFGLHATYRHTIGHAVFEVLLKNDGCKQTKDGIFCLFLECTVT